VLSFREHMWDQFELLWKRRVEPSRRQLEAFVVCLRDRAQLERQYAKGLERALGRMQPEVEQGGVPVAMEALAHNMRSRCEQSLQLADEVEQDVAVTVEAMLRQHSEVSKRVLADGQRLTRHWQEARRSHDQLAARYAQVGAEAEACAGECLHAAPARPAEWKRLAERSVALSRQAATVEREYYKAVQRLNSAAELHGRQMGLVLGALQDMEEKRALCFRDAAMKIAVYDTSWLRNMQYDLDSAVQAVESADTAAELQEFIRTHQSQAQPPSKLSAQAYWDLPTFGQVAEGKAPATVAIAASPAVQQLQAVRPLCAALLAPEAAAFEAAASGSLREEESLESIRQALGPKEVPEGQAAAINPEEHGEGQCGGSPAAYRTSLCTALREEIQARGPPRRDGDQPVPSEDLPSVRISSPAFEAAVSLFLAALDGCDRSGDAWNGRDLMVLAQKIQCQSEDGRTVDVLLKVYNHPLWSRVTFWEDMLLVGIAEAYSLQALARRSAAAGTEHREAAMTAFLQRYVGYMVALGIKAEQAQGCVQRTLRKHQHLLGQCAEAYVELLRGSAPDSTAGGAAAAGDGADAPAAASLGDSGTATPGEAVSTAAAPSAAPAAAPSVAASAKPAEGAAGAIATAAPVAVAE